MPLPPLPEQQQIASILSTIDDYITKLNYLKDQLERLKKRRAE
ncbi:MAG: restriction endonuclease subunit S [Minisyncoccia bacterium]